MALLTVFSHPRTAPMRPLQLHSNTKTTTNQTNIHRDFIVTTIMASNETAKEYQGKTLVN